MNNNEEQAFKEGLKVDITTQQKQIKENFENSINDHINIMENKEFCENFIAGYLLETKRMYPDLNFGCRFRYKSPGSSLNKLFETIYRKNTDTGIEFNFNIKENGNLEFSKGLYDSCAVRLILMNIPSFESLQNNIYLTDDEKKELKSSYKLYVNYRKFYYTMQQRYQKMLNTGSEEEYYNIHIDICRKISEIESEVRRKLKDKSEMKNKKTGDEEKYKNKARILQIDLEDEKVLTKVSDRQIEDLEADMDFLESELTDIIERDISNIVFPSVMTHSRLLSKRFNATISNDDVRTKQKAKKNGYISDFNGSNISCFGKELKIEWQIQSLHRYIKHKQTHTEMDGKFMELPELPNENDPEYEQKIAEYIEYINNILFEGYELHFSVEIPDEVEIFPHSKEDDLERIFVPYKDTKNYSVMNEFKDQINKLKDLGILQERDIKPKTYSLKSINDYLDKQEKNRENIR